MGKRIIKSILWLMVVVPFMASAHTGITRQSGCDDIVMLPDLVEGHSSLNNREFKGFTFSVKQKAPARTRQDIHYIHVVLTESGTLASVLGDKKLEIDSISVEGPMNSVDFNTLWESSFNGRLTSVNLENALIENGIIPEYAFFHKDVQIDWDTWIITTTPLEKVILPDNITQIGKDAFAYNIDLAEINFPTSLRYIGVSAFTDCISLRCEQLAFPEGLEKLDEQAFYQCRGLDGPITLPSSLTWIDAAVFYNCRISDINIPEKLEYLGCFAFAGSRFKKGILPDDCYLCPHGCQFYNNWELTEVHLPDNLGFVPPDIFSGCVELAIANIPSQAVKIGEFAFDGTKIKTSDFPETLESIGQDAFQGCDGLTVVVLPASLKSLGDRAFALCTNLKSIWCKATVPPEYLPAQGYESDRTPFASVNISMPVYIPIGTKQQYMKAPGWDYMTNFIETDDFPSAGIEFVSTDEKEKDNNTYDLFGRKVETPIPGNVYIRNGVKFIQH